MGRLELPRVTPLEPKSSASTSFATFARKDPFLAVVLPRSRGRNWTTDLNAGFDVTRIAALHYKLMPDFFTPILTRLLQQCPFLCINHMLAIELY